MSDKNKFTEILKRQAGNTYNTMIIDFGTGLSEIDDKDVGEFLISYLTTIVGSFTFEVCKGNQQLISTIVARMASNVIGNKPSFIAQQQPDGSFKTVEVADAN